MDVWDCELIGVEAYAKYNDNYRYIFSVIEVFSKYLYLIPIWAKNGISVASAFWSIFHERRRRRPIWVRTDKGKEFLNNLLQDMLQDEGGIRFQVCRNTDLKCAVMERVQRTIRDRLYKYFTHKYTYRYIDVLPQFVKAYNDTVHWTTAMAPSRVTDSDVLAIWKRMEAARRGRVRVAKAATFRVGQHVRISKESMRFAKPAEQNFSTETFKVAKANDRRQRAVYELVDLNGTPIDSQFHHEELTPERITDLTFYKTDKILHMRGRRGIRENLVRWRGYGQEFDSWVPAASVKNI